MPVPFSFQYTFDLCQIGTFVKNTDTVPVPYSVHYTFSPCHIGTVPEKLLTVPDAPLDVRFGNTKVYINDTLDVDQVRPLTINIFVQII